MIVLDEQLLGRGVEQAIATWYGGRVCSVKDLRPGTIIKDEAIPMLLAQERKPTFVTINESDFWKVLPANLRFSIVCFAMPSKNVAQIPDLLRELLRVKAFDTQAKRSGKVICVTQTGTVTYYEAGREGVTGVDAA